MRAHPSLLLLAIGNPDRGDDAVAWEVAAALEARLPEGAVIERCRGDLLSTIENWPQYDAMICIDATAPRGRPGRISRFDLGDWPLPVAFEAVSSHAFGLGQTLALAQSLDLVPTRTIVYAIEGADFATGAPLSDGAVAAIAHATEAILAEAHLLLEGTAHA